MVEEETKMEPVAEADGIDRLFQERAEQADNAAFLKSARRLRRMTYGGVIILLFLFYIFLPASRVRTVSVQGNIYLSKEYIQELSRCTIDHLYYFLIPPQIAARVKADPMIADCTVRLEKNGILSIVVKERTPFAYRFDQEDAVPKILCTDGASFDLTSAYMPILSRIPLLQGFREEQQEHLLCNAFSDIDPKMISAMAQISQYALSYDDQTIQIQMMDGGYFFSSYYDLRSISEYDRLAARQTNKKFCLYAGNGGKVAYSASCPWDTPATPRDYWMDDEGNYIINRFGDRAIKHYYRDANGGYYLDEAGNWILIPLDKQGDEVPDADFLKHYEAGYYASGQLVLPEVEEEAG